MSFQLWNIKITPIISFIDDCFSGSAAFDTVNTFFCKDKTLNGKSWYFFVWAIFFANYK